MPGGVKFSKDVAGRVARATLRVERSNINGPPGGYNRASGFMFPVFRAVCTTAIPPGSWGTPSDEGRAQLRFKDSEGEWVDDGDPVEVFNDHTFTDPIATGKVLKLALIGGDYWLLAADCPT